MLTGAVVLYKRHHRRKDDESDEIMPTPYYSTQEGIEVVYSRQEKSASPGAEYRYKTSAMVNVNGVSRLPTQRMKTYE